MSPAVEVRVVEPTHVSEARRTAARMAEPLGFDEESKGKLALVVTELATNLVKHARGGSILLSPVNDAGSNALDVFGVDKGVGMENFTECLQDGYSTAGSPGTGLGAVVRLSSETDVLTIPGQGTVIRARCLANARAAATYGAPQIDVNGVVVAYPGETESGDTWRFRRHADGVTVLMVDGLGHGPEAAKAATAAAEIFNARPDLTGVPLMERVDQGLRGTRGAAIAIVDIGEAGQLLFTGVGNIAGVICNGPAPQHLVSMNGIVGHRMGRPRQYQYTLPPDFIVVLHSDGINNRWKLADYRGLQSKSAGLIAATLLRDASRGTDDATVVVARSGGATNAL